MMNPKINVRKQYTLKTTDGRKLFTYIAASETLRLDCLLRNNDYFQLEAAQIVELYEFITHVLTEECKK